MFGKVYPPVPVPPKSDRPQPFLQEGWGRLTHHPSQVSSAAAIFRSSITVICPELKAVEDT